MRTLISFDPGVTLGVSIFFDDTLWDSYILEQKEHYHFFEHQFPKLTTGQTVVVCENYIGYYLTAPAKETIMLIGVIELFTRQHLGTLPVYQRAQKRISFLPQAKKLVRQLPVQRRWTQHHFDSAAQGLAYLYYSRNDSAVLAPDLCSTQGAAHEPTTA